MRASTPKSNFTRRTATPKTNFSGRIYSNSDKPVSTQPTQASEKEVKEAMDKTEFVSIDISSIKKNKND